MASEFPPFDGSAPRKQDSGPHRRWASTRPSATRPRSTRRSATLVIALDAVEGAEDGQQLRVPRRSPLLRRRHLPPHHQRLHVPGRRPDRHRPRRPRLPVRGRAAQAGAVRDRLGGDGQRRPEHQRQPVLHRSAAPSGVAPAAAVHAVRQGREGPRRRRRDAERARPARGDRPNDDVVINSVTITEVATDAWPARSTVAPRSSPAPGAASARRSPRALDAAGARVALSPAPRRQLEETAATLANDPVVIVADLGTPDGPAGGRRRGARRVRRAGRRARQQRRRRAAQGQRRAHRRRDRPAAATSTCARPCSLTTAVAAVDARRRLRLDHLDQLDQRPARHAAPGRRTRRARRRSTA